MAKKTPEERIAEMQVARDLATSFMHEVIGNPLISMLGVVLLAEYAHHKVSYKPGQTTGTRWLSADMKRLVQVGAISAAAVNTGVGQSVAAIAPLVGKGVAEAARTTKAGLQKAIQGIKKLGRKKPEDIDIPLLPGV